MGVPQQLVFSVLVEDYVVRPFKSSNVFITYYLFCSLEGPMDECEGASVPVEGYVFIRFKSSLANANNVSYLWAFACKSWITKNAGGIDIGDMIHDT